jgi:hypothetical protein
VACIRQEPETASPKETPTDSIRHTAWDGDNTHPDIFSRRMQPQKNTRVRLKFLENYASSLPSDRKANPDAINP